MAPNIILMQLTQVGRR